MIEMSYFGTSGPRSNVAHSIGAGFQRQLNLNNARKTSPFGRLGSVKDTIETRAVNIRDRANDAYNRKFTEPYGDVNELFQLVTDWRSYEGNVVAAKRRDLDAATARYTALRENIKTLEGNHAQIQRELDLIAANRAEEADTAKVATLTVETEKLFSGYKVNNYATIRSAALKELDVLLGKKTAAEIALRDATVVLDRVHTKKVEDWMVDGPLMRESKTALIAMPTAAIIGAGLVAYYAYSKSQSKYKRTPTANKGAAFAVFS